MRFTRIAASAAIGIAAIAGSALPVEAHPLAAVFTGTATTSGTWTPWSPACGTTPCPDATTWSFISTVDIFSDGTIDSNRVSGVGAFTGWCGGSVGTGNFTLGLHNGTVNWASVGTIFVLAGSADGHAAAAAVVSSRAVNGTGNCVTAPATQYDIVGVVAGA